MIGKITLRIALLLGILSVSAYAAPAIGILAGVGASAAGASLAASVAIGAGALAVSQYQANKQEAAVRDANAAAEAARIAAEQKAANARQLGEQTGIGSVKEATGRTLGDTDEEDARTAVRKKRLGTTKLRIDPLENTGTSTAEGISATPTTGLQI